MDYNIDARGRSCPEPVIMTQNAIDKGLRGDLKVLVDSHVAVENITRFANNKNYNVSFDEEDGIFLIKIEIR